MTASEVYTAIYKSNEDKCYEIVYLINNNKIKEAVHKILSIFDCDESAAEEVAYRFKEKLGK